MIQKPRSDHESMTHPELHSGEDQATGFTQIQQHDHGPLDEKPNPSDDLPSLDELETLNQFRGDRLASLEAARARDAKERGLYVPPAPRMECEQSPHSMPEGLDGYETLNSLKGGERDPSREPVVEESLLGEDLDRSLSQLQKWGKYTSITHVSQGGMGDVYRAFDPSLGRFVALKVIRGAHPELAHRFLFEARAQARVEHEHVCRVYESGHFKGLPYIAMQFIEGMSLNDLAPSLKLMEKVEIMLHVSEAVHAAHLKGLIHRDLKPSNIMLEQEPSGRWKPFVVDFGVCREMGEAGMTHTGCAVGTPAYMSPEQARGESSHLDFRTDVYGLGATLYTLLTLHPPFEGRVLEVLTQVQTLDPPRPRKLDREIPLDLESIVLKALEKAPERRYASAQAFAEDLQRFLSSKPVMAVPPSLLYRLRKQVERNRTLSAVVAASLALLLLMGGWAIRTSLRGREQARLAQRFGREAERLDTRLRLGRLLPLHDLQSEVDETRTRIKTMESEIRKLGRLAEGPGYLALGQTCMNLGDVARGLRYLQEAWKSGEQSPEAAQSLGLALGEHFLNEQRKAFRNAYQGRLSPLQRQQLEALRNEALYYLRIGTATSGPATPIARAMMAFCEDRHEEALNLCQMAFEATPWMYESQLLAAKHSILMSERARAEHHYVEADSRMKRAEEALAAVQAVAASEAQVYILMAEVAKSRSNQADWQGQDALPVLEKMESQARRALQAESQSGEAFLVLGQALLRKVMWQAERRGRSGVELRQLLEEAKNHFHSVLAQDPNHGYAHLHLSECLFASAMEAGNRNEDPLPYCREAVQEALRAQELEPHQVFDCQDRLGRIHYQQAVWELEQGMTTPTSATACVEAFQKAREVQPDNITVASNQALARLLLAEWQREYLGVDPIPQLHQAMVDWRRGLEREPEDPALHINLGLGLTQLGLERLRAGEAGDPEFLEGIRALEKGMATLKQEPESPMSIGQALQARATLQLQEDVDPMPALRRARSMFVEALRLSQNANEFMLDLAATHLGEGEWLLKRGQKSSAPLHSAQTCLEKVPPSLRKGPKGSLLRARLALLFHLIQGGSDSAQGALDELAAARRAHPAYLPLLLLEAETLIEMKNPATQAMLASFQAQGSHFRSRPWTQALAGALHLLQNPHSSSNQEARRKLLHAVQVRPGLARRFREELKRLGA